MFLCQLSKKSTLVPVCTKYGTIYDYHSIVNYINKHHCDPNTQEPLTEKDLIKIDNSYLLQTFENNFTDDKEKLLSRLLYERDAMIRVVAKVMQDYNHENEDRPVKRKKVEQEYTFHDFKEAIKSIDIMQIRKQKNKQIKGMKLELKSGEELDEFPNGLVHPLGTAVLDIKNKIYLMHDSHAIKEYILHTKKKYKFAVWHCDLNLFFISYNTFIDIYHIDDGYVDTMHIKYEINSLKCCPNGYFIGISNLNNEIDIFDLRKSSDDSKGYLKSIPINANSPFGFAKNGDLIVFSDTIK